MEAKLSIVEKQKRKPRITVKEETNFYGKIVKANAQTDQYKYQTNENTKFSVLYVVMVISACWQLNILLDSYSTIKEIMYIWVNNATSKCLTQLLPQ